MYRIWVHTGNSWEIYYKQKDQIPYEGVKSEDLGDIDKRCQEISEQNPRLVFSINHDLHGPGEIALYNGGIGYYPPFKQEENDSIVKSNP